MSLSPRSTTPVMKIGTSGVWVPGSVQDAEKDSHPSSNMNPQENPSNYQRHSRFYFPDGNVIFLVDGVLFKIHRYFFERDSSIFSSMFSLPPPIGERTEGEVDENPIVLADIHVKDFEHFLVVLYPVNFRHQELTTVGDWTSVLALATRWDFASVRSLAIDRLATIIDSAESVALGKRHDVRDWLMPAYLDLCVRDQPLTIQEGHNLGMEDVIEIGRVRSHIRYLSNLNRHPDTIRTLVEQKFHS